MGETECGLTRPLSVVQSPVVATKTQTITALCKTIPDEVADQEEYTVTVKGAETAEIVAKLLFTMQGAIGVSFLYRHIDGRLQEAWRSQCLFLHRPPSRSVH